MPSGEGARGDAGARDPGTARRSASAGAASDDLASLRRWDDLLLQTVGEGVFRLDAAGNVSLVNMSGARMLGYEPGELAGRPLHAAVHAKRADGSTYPESRCPILATLRDGSVHHATGEVFWRKDGTGLHVEYTSAPLREGERVTGALVVFGDTSERGRAEDAMRRANQKILRIYENIPEAFFQVDKEWRLVYMNPLAERMRATPKEEVLGKVLWDAFPDLAGTKFDTEYHRAVAQRVPVVVEEYYPRMGRWFEGSAYPTEEGLSVYFRDTTARKRTEEELKAASIARPLARRIVGDLVEAGAVAHQILSNVGRKIAEESSAGSLEAFVQAYNDMGLGSLALDKADATRATFVGRDLLERRPSSRIPTCSFTLGFVSEALSKTRAGEPTLGTEIECQSRGAPVCRFVVQVKKAEEGLARRVKELI